MWYKCSVRALHKEQWEPSPNSPTGDDAWVKSEERKECRKEVAMWVRRMDPHLAKPSCMRTLLFVRELPVVWNVWSIKGCWS